jgi:DNA-binding response OmpR family regulator
MKILIVEDEKELLLEIQEYLQREHFLCEIASDFHLAESSIATFEYDIAIIDISLPGGSGLDLVRMIKMLYPETGIIIVSAKNSIDDKLTGLDLGADDYITKPFHSPSSCTTQQEHCFFPFRYTPIHSAFGQSTTF